MTGIVMRIIDFIGAGDEIRTHDPNLGKVSDVPLPLYPTSRYDTKKCDKSDS